jgi:opacity protein-like surface antigen
MSLFFGVCCLVCCWSAAFADIMPPGTHELGGSAELVFPEDGSYVYLGPRFGTVFSPGAEVEVEVGYTRQSDGITYSRLSFAANLVYSFETMSAPYPFVLAGLGFARSHWGSDDAGGRYDEDETNALLNLGAGLRVPLTESCCLRTELRYTREFASPDVSTTAIRAGFSVLLH